MSSGLVPSARRGRQVVMKFASEVRRESWWGKGAGGDGGGCRTERDVGW